MATLTEAEKTLQKYFGFDRFRPAQVPIIEAVLSEQDVLALLPTGGGKSLCFQVPGLLHKGITIVISPLIALMLDQVRQLKKRNIAAACWHSQLSKQEVISVQSDLHQRSLKFLYLSPEKLWHPQVKKLLKKTLISCLVIDEAHCIALWGHDFRPHYLKIKHWLKEQKVKPQILALTATATPKVQAEIIQFLGLTHPLIINQNSVRNNLALHVLWRNSPTKKLITLLTLLEQYQNQTVIVYCSTRSEVERLWQTLTTLLGKTEIYHYHGGLRKTERSLAQQKFLTAKSAILVATNAFGMGIDKPNIRLIVHYQLPSNLENYAQEIGRAGRDGLLAATALLVSETDWQIQLELAASQPNHAYKMRYLKYYLETQRCRLGMLNEYFGEPYENCHHCDVCTGNLSLMPLSQTQHLYQQLVQLKIPYRQTLKLISLIKPQTLSALQKIPGIGEGWRNRWGEQILNQVNAMC